MNRRKLLSLIGATALTPVIPAQVFAAGGIVNPSSVCITGERGPEYLVPRGRWMADGNLVGQGLTYAPSASDIGKSITFSITAGA